MIILTSQDNESRFLFLFFARLVQQAKCLKLKGKEDIDLDNLFRGKTNKQTNKSNSSKCTEAATNWTANKCALLVGQVESYWVESLTSEIRCLLG